MPERVVNVTPGEQWRVDTGSLDPGRYDPPPPVTGGDTWERLQDAHAAYHNGSPYELHMTACAGCGTPVTFYGRAVDKPAEPLCPGCAP